MRFIGRLGVAVTLMGASAGCAGLLGINEPGMETLDASDNTLASTELGSVDGAPGDASPSGVVSGDQDAATGSQSATDGNQGTTNGSQDATSGNAPPLDASACEAGSAAPGQCAPPNPCSTGHGGCDTNAACTSLEAGVNTCTCNEGYSGDGGTCQAIDACATDHGGCNAALPCVATGPGTRTCLTVTELATGDAFNCVRMSDATVRCWGLNGIYELGTSAVTQSAVPVEVNDSTGNPLQNVTAIATGAFFACAILRGGEVQCWGDDSSGQLGNLTTGSSIQPVTATVSGVVQVGAGHIQNCELLTGGLVQCWGGNTYGQLGDNSTTSSLAPVTAIASGAAIVSASEYDTCALTGGGAVDCWGSNFYGQIGDGSNTDVWVPTLAIASGATGIAAGAGHACAVVSGSAVCWGRNGNGQLGIGTTTDTNTPATAIASGVSAVAASAFDFNPAHTCALMNSGAVECWGGNGYGQLGDGTTTDQPSPVTSIAGGAVAVACGTRHTCALMGDGTVRCWGDDTYGATAGASTTSPVVIAQ